MSSIVVLIPVYQPELSPADRFSLQHSVACLKPGRTVCFIGPEGLDMSAYAADFPGIPLIAFDKVCFESIKGYNRLLMSPVFYERFAAFEFMLILQTDAILLRDELDDWIAKPYDYVGAPWPDGVEIVVNLDRFTGEHAKKVKVHVGNGGLSLRRNQACIALLSEFPQALDFFIRTGSSEDLFFSIMGSLSSSFVIPNEIVASTFSLELKPEHYHHINQQKPPMGGHAWLKYNQPFWLSLLGSHAPRELLAAH
ncbi:MAG: hypothetical protein EOP38_18285 [Rubrivivax sp.]|nr:MAG: hypothetical protein EOP38_18285 [Rubrivivax sp.]